MPVCWLLIVAPPTQFRQYTPPFPLTTPYTSVPFLPPSPHHTSKISSQYWSTVNSFAYLVAMCWRLTAIEQNLHQVLRSRECFDDLSVQWLVIHSHEYPAIFYIYCLPDVWFCHLICYLFQGVWVGFKSRKGTNMVRGIPFINPDKEWWNSRLM